MHLLNYIILHFLKIEVHTIKCINHDVQPDTLTKPITRIKVSNILIHLSFHHGLTPPIQPCSFSVVTNLFCFFHFFFPT